jgi:release factor glutamine methyltransferase
MLRAADIDPLDARVLLRAVLQASDAYIAAHPEQPLSDEQRGRYLASVERRRAGEPVAYLTGEREFYSLAFKVTPDVLIPRPETELLVDLALERATPGRARRVLDLATGSGCVAIAIARNCAHAQVTATDVSGAALALARDNAARHGVAVEFLESDWFAALAERRFDVIVANPPYVAAGDPCLTQGDTRFEPRNALLAGPTGYECIETIAAQAPRHLEPGGWLLFEHGYDQAPRCRELLAHAGYQAVFSAPDLAGIERVSGGRV